MHGVNYAEYALRDYVVKRDCMDLHVWLPPHLFPLTGIARIRTNWRADLHITSEEKQMWSFYLIRTLLSKWIKVVFNFITLNSWIRSANKSLTFTAGVFLELVYDPT